MHRRAIPVRIVSGIPEAIRPTRHRQGQPRRRRMSKSSAAFSGESGRLKKGIQTEVSAMTMPAAFQGGLVADLGLLQPVPVQVKMEIAAQRFELVKFLSADQFSRCLMDRLGLGFGGGHNHELPNEFVVEIQGRTHTQVLFDMPVSYA